jgi:hypothetical protein
MGLQRVPRQAFNRGKISRLGLGRTDVERVELSAETQTNFMPRVLGSMMLRPGWKYLGSTLSDTQAFLLPFVKSTDDTAFIELTNESMRVWEDDVVIERNAVSTTTRGGDFASESPATAFTKLTDPSTLPADGGDRDCIAWSPDGQFMFASNDTSPFHRQYYVSGTTFTALANLGTLPAASVHSATYSPDSQLLVVGENAGTFIKVYYVTGTGASATWTKLDDSVFDVLPGNTVTGVSFSPDGSLLGLATFTGDFVYTYSVSGTGSGTTFTQLADPATLPTGAGNGCAFSWDGRFFTVAHSTSPFITIYEVNGQTFTKLDNPASLPAGIGNGVEFSRDGNWMSVAHNTTPFITNYAISGTTFTKASDPASLPASTGTQVSFSSDNQFVAVSHTTTPFVTIYRNVAGVWTKQTNPVTLPTGNGYGVGFSHNNRFLAVNHQVSPFITIYEAYQWLDMDGSGATSTYGGAVPGSFEVTDTWNCDTNPSVALTNTNIRVVIEAAALTRSGNRVRLTFTSGTVQNFAIDDCYIGKAFTPLGGGHDAYDFSNAPTQVTFNGGSSGFDIALSSSQVSDEIVFDLDEARNYIVSYHITNNAAKDYAQADASASSITTYRKAGATESTTLNVTGYTTHSQAVLGLDTLEVLNVEDGGTGMYLVGTNYNDARRTQSISILEADKNTEHGIRIIVDQGLVDFHVGTAFGDDDLVTKRTLGKGIYSFAFTPGVNLIYVEIHSNTEYSSIVSSIQIDGGGDLTIPTAYATDDLQYIRHDQSGDVIFLACRGNKQQKLMRFGSGSWGVADYLPEDGPFLNENTDFTTLTPSALTGDITIAASKDYFKESQVNGLIRITSVGQTVEDDLNGANQFTSHIKVTNVGTARDITITRAGTWSATVTLQRSISEPGTWVDVATFTTNGTATYNDGLDNQTIYYRIGIKTGNYTSGTATLTLSYESGGIDGIARITAFTDQQNVDAIVLSPMGGTDAFETWAEGIWSDRRGWPSSVALYEGRLAWAGMDKIILSESDGYENFNDLQEGDSGPIIRNIGQGPVDDIHWLLPLQRLIAGAEGSELSIRSNSFDEPLTPDNYNMKAASTQGSAPVGAVRIDSNGAFVERSGTRVYQLVYNFDTYDYSSSDLTRLVPDMCDVGIVKVVVQRHPDTRLHCVLENGTVAVLIFEPDEDVICWIDVTTDGLVEDAVVLPQQELEDAVYYVVNRTINGETKRFVEKWALEEDCVGGTLNHQADSYLEFTQAASATVSGLDHLEGESVVVWADGKCLRTSAGAIATFTVTSGAITLTNAGSSYSATTGIVGLPYTAQYESSKLAYAAEGGTALNARKILHSIGIIAADMHHKGLEYGDSFSFLRPLAQVYRNKDVTVDTVHTEYDDDLIPINKSWGTDTRLCLQASAPRPATILAITMAIETNG